MRQWQWAVSNACSVTPLRLCQQCPFPVSRLTHQVPFAAICSLVSTVARLYIIPLIHLLNIEHDNIQQQTTSYVLLSFSVYNKCLSGLT